ncbi:unnamed protein product, partial [Prorocentrum cordatum]
PTTNVVPNQRRPPLGGRPSVSNGHRPRRRGQRVLSKPNRKCCLASYPSFPCPSRSCRKARPTDEKRGSQDRPPETTVPRTGTGEREPSPRVQVHGTRPPHAARPPGAGGGRAGPRPVLRAGAGGRCAAAGSKHGALARRGQSRKSGAQILKQAPVAGRQPRMHKASRHGGRPMRVAAPLALPRSLAGLRWIGSLNHVYCEAPSGAGRRMDLCRGRNNEAIICINAGRGRRGAGAAAPRGRARGARARRRARSPQGRAPRAGPPPPLGGTELGGEGGEGERRLRRPTSRGGSQLRAASRARGASRSPAPPA